MCTYSLIPLQSLDYEKKLNSLSENAAFTPQIHKFIQSKWINLNDEASRKLFVLFPDMLHAIFLLRYYVTSVHDNKNDPN